MASRVLFLASALKRPAFRFAADMVPSFVESSGFGHEFGLRGGDNREHRIGGRDGDQTGTGPKCCAPG